MCTVSWRFHPDGYDFFFSRDEQRTRPTALPPRPYSRDGVEWLAPYDPQGGGSWIIVNSHGLTACVLNAYTIDAAPAPTSPVQSRGRLPLALADARNATECREKLDHLLADGRFAPCFLLCVHPPAEAVWWIWAGAVLHRLGSAIRPPITTSSYDSERIILARRDAFQKIVGTEQPTLEQLRQFHEGPDQPAEAASVRMSRPDARTVSLTHIAVSGSEVRTTYAERDGDDGFLPPQKLAIPQSPSRVKLTMLMP